MKKPDLKVKPTVLKIIKDNIMDNLFDHFKLDMVHRRAISTEMIRYILLTGITLKREDLIQWWVSKLTEFPVLSKLVLTILAIPTSSSTVEGSFSSFKNVLKDNRKHLRAEKLEMIQMLGYNKSL